MDNDIWRHPSLSELTPMLFNTGLTHLESQASILSRTNLSYDRPKPLKVDSYVPIYDNGLAVFIFSFR